MTGNPEPQADVEAARLRRELVDLWLKATPGKLKQFEAAVDACLAGALQRARTEGHAAGVREEWERYNKLVREEWERYNELFLAASGIMWDRDDEEGLHYCSIEEARRLMVAVAALREPPT